MFSILLMQFSYILIKINNSQSHIEPSDKYSFHIYNGVLKRVLLRLVTEEIIIVKL